MHYRLKRYWGLLLLAALSAGCAHAELPPIVTPFVASLPSATLTPSATAPAPAAVSTATQPATATAPSATPTTTPALSQTPSAAPAGMQYTVVAGDTVWGIALQFGLSPERLVDANPALSSGLLQPGEVLIIPNAGDPAPTDPPGVVGRVRPDGGGLRLHAEPGDASEVLGELFAFTRLQIVGRTPSAAWLQVVTPAALGGWVTAAWLDAGLALSQVPVTAEDPAGPAASPPPPTGDLPVFDNLTGVTDHARAIFALGQSLGNKPDAFSKVGDSITASPVFLNPIGLGQYDLHGFTQYQDVINFYYYALARGSANSFANASLAAKTSWRAQAVLNPASADHTLCLEGEAPLPCEFRLVRPSVALIMLGTNDVPSTSDINFAADLSRVIEYCQEQGVVPVVSTIPPLYRVGLEGRAEQLNVVIASLARQYDVPLWDYYAALQGLPGAGMAKDGVHPNSAPAGHNADFSAEYLQYGMVVRNLNALYVLDQVWRQVIQP